MWICIARCDSIPGIGELSGGYIMRTFANALIGGIAVILVATATGVVHNTVRPQPVTLIQRVPAPARTDATGTGGGSPAPVGESVGAREALAGEVPSHEMKRLYDEGVTVILDARSPAEYAEGHIPGAINIPYDELPQYLEALQSEAAPDQSVVCYCRGLLCDLSDHLATELRLMGYGDVNVFKGGWDEWTEAGHPVVTGTEP